MTKTVRALPHRISERPDLRDYDGPQPKRTLPAESFAHLPVKEKVEIVPEAVRAAPELCDKIGEERAFEVDVAPPQLFKREIVRPKFRH